MHTSKIWIFAFIFLIASLATLSSLHATTFGEYRVVDQIKNADYVVHGKIGESWTAIEPYSKRPYTYWKLDVVRTLKGDQLAGRISIRRPGGEIDGVGYFIASSANFKKNEEVVVNLRDSNQEAKEVVGLASGKYTLKRIGFKTELHNPIAGKIALDLEEFTELANRVEQGSITESDQKILLRPTRGQHNHAPHHAHVVSPVKKPPETIPEQKNVKQKPQLIAKKINKNNIQKNISTSDESTNDLRKEWTWKTIFWIIISVVAIFASAIFIRSRN